MPADVPRAAGAAAGRRRVPLTRVLRAVRDMGDVRGSSPKQILGRLNDEAPAGKEFDKIRLALTLKKGVEAGALTVRSGRYQVATTTTAANNRELCCRRRRRRRSCRRRRRRSCRRRRRSCRRRRRRSCRRRRRRSCRRRRRRSCRRRRRRSCRRRRRSCRRRRRSCRRRRRRCSNDDMMSDAASLESRVDHRGQSREASRAPSGGGVAVPVGVGVAAGGGTGGAQRATGVEEQSHQE